MQKLESINNIPTQEPLVSRWGRAEWRAEIASSVDWFAQYAHWNGCREQGKVDLICCMISLSKYIMIVEISSGGECDGAVVIEIGWRWLLQHSCDWWLACGDNSLVQRGLKDVCEDIFKLLGIFFQHTTRYAVWNSNLTRYYLIWRVCSSHWPSDDHQMGSGSA